ncbi:autophagy-related protein 17 [Lentinula edodes]|nr:autophagy-related protein 17 [Lentinula edodes]
MSVAPASDPHIVSLVLQSKKALQEGEQICSKANELSATSTQTSIDVLILDAKVKWITDNVLEQLKLAAFVAKSIEEKRTKLNKQVQDWDNLRTKQTDALDKILNELGSQRVPPDFHQTSTASSIFGSQDSEDEQQNYKQSNGLSTLSRSPSDTIQVPRPKPQADLKNWKTLRDFVDDQAIEDIFECMEEEHTIVEDILSRTDEYSEKLTTAIHSIREYLPEMTPPPSIEQLITSQDSAQIGMAGHLESLAAHYDQMCNALREREAGDVFGEDDLQDMNRDTEELPSILSELEENLRSVTATYDQLCQIRDTNQEHINRLSNVLDELDELGDIMTEMLQTQETVESECEQHFTQMQRHLLTVEDLQQQFISYQTAFRKLILEIARRRVYKEAAENIVRGMMDQLTAMTEEERRVREHFNQEQGAHLPEDLCLCISNYPTKWDISPWAGEVLESLPDIPTDMVTEARNHVRTEPPSVVNGTESL